MTKTTQEVFKGNHKKNLFEELKLFSLKKKDQNLIKYR
jgi:hypothetical protein